MARNFKSSGNIALKGDIQPFFGDTGDASLTEFYKSSGSSAVVPDNALNVNIPASGNIKMTDFRGATNEYYALSVSPQALNEGAVQTITLTTRNVPQNDPVYFTVTGIQSEDVVGNPALSGAFLAGYTSWAGLTGLSTHAVSFTMKNDLVSDGGFDGDGYPLANNETGEVTIYTDSGRGTPMGGVDYETWSIIDTSLSWFVKITTPSKVGGVYLATATVQGEGLSGQYLSNPYVDGDTPAFKIDGYNAPTNFTVEKEFDTGFGTSGRSVTGSTSAHRNQNLTFGGYPLADTYIPSSWSGNPDTPQLVIQRRGYFNPGTYYVDQTGLKIQEKVRFKLTETGGTGRVIYSDYCIVETIHDLAIVIG